MKKLRIGLDFDGVIANTPALRSEAVKTILGKEVPTELMRNKRYVVGNGLLSQEEYGTMQRAIYAEDSGWPKKLACMPGAKEGIEELLNDGHDVCCITSRTPTALTLAEQWLKEQKIPISIFGITEESGKLGVVKRHEREIYIDDDPHYLLPMAGKIPHLFLYSWKHNENEILPPEIARVSSWNEFLSQIESIYLSTQTG